MFKTYIRIIDKTTQISSPATLVREGLRRYSRVMSSEQYNQKFFFLSQIKIYKDGIIKDPVHDYETLKLFHQLDQSLINGDKKQALDLIKKFLLNTQEELYYDDFGKAKQHLGDILYSHKKITKITPLEILENIGYEKKQLIDLGVLETTLNKTKNCVSSTVFEILVMDALPEKYPVIQKVQYCQDGAVPITSEVINKTDQKNPDYVLTLKQETGSIINVASDSKAQKFDTAISNMEKKGNQNNVLTIAGVPDDVITSHSVFKQSLIRSKKNILKLSEIDKEKLSESEGEKGKEKDLIINDNKNLHKLYDQHLVSPLIPTFFISTKDIAKNVAKMNKNKLPEKKNNENDID